MSLAVGVLAWLHQVGGLDEGQFPFIGGGALGRVVQSVYEGPVKKLFEIGAADGVGEFCDISLRQFARSQIVHLWAVALVGGMFDEESLLSHGQLFVSGSVKVVDLPAS